MWTVLIAVVILRTGSCPALDGRERRGAGVGIAAGLAEPAGWELGGTINASATWSGRSG